MSHASYVDARDILTDLRRLMGLAERFTRVRWVLPHAGNAAVGQAQAIEVTRARLSIYLETATSFAQHGTIEHLEDGAGPDRVLYGSDMPLMDARFPIGRIATAYIPADAKRKVLRLNAMRLLGFEG